MIPVRPGDEDTICAISTAPGVGAISVIRVSGSKALSTVSRLAPFLVSNPESHRLYFGSLKDPVSGDLIDEVLIAYFADGKSFTGEETIEISCHGGDAISSRILDTLIGQGSRLARPGEFTYRAFLNGRVDLVQAEGILGLIESRSKESSAAALSQLKGELSRKFSLIEDDLVWIGAQLEASIDFSSDGIELKPSKDLLERAQALNSRVGDLISSYQKGRLLRNGLAVALVGSPNAGKSSLLNAIVEEERAIVTDQPGTTRDWIEVETRFHGTPIRWIDTAGIRETRDVVERLGVEKSLHARNTADAVVVVIDIGDSEWRVGFADFVRGAKRAEHYFFNKVDLDRTGEWRATAEAEAERLGVSARTMFGSAVTGAGIGDLKTMIAGPIREIEGLGGAGLVTQARHVEGLKKIQGSVAKALNLIEKDASPELIAYELQVGLKAVHELLGKVFHEQVIDRIFKEFCLGK